jgi:hypothetical protein
VFEASDDDEQGRRDRRLRARRRELADYLFDEGRDRSLHDLLREPLQRMRKGAAGLAAL